MKTAIYLSLMIFLSNNFLFAQKIPIPAHYSIVDTVTGDLDQDGIKELVVAYNTEEINEDRDQGVPRELIIYKKQNDGWTVWKRSNQALYGSQDGGMMGDPFGSIEIKNGILMISESGGSSWKWGHTDKYRFQNGEFYLIGYTKIEGKQCEYWEEVDFNLSTGQINIKKEHLNCDEDEPAIYKNEKETFYKKGVKITLQNRSGVRPEIISPKNRRVALD